MTTKIQNIFYFVLVALFSASPAYADITYQVGKDVVGYEYNHLIKKSLEKKLRILVQINPSEEVWEEVIILTSDTGVGAAKVFIEYSSEAKDEFEALVIKAIKWSNVATKNKVDIQKSVGCISDTFVPHCEGIATREGVVGFSFVSENKGQQTYLILSMIDNFNQFIKASLVLKPSEMKTLLNNIRKIDGTLEKARNEAKKETLFK